MDETKSDRLSPWWKQSVILIMIAAFTVLIVIAVRSYRDAPPIPSVTFDQRGDTLFTSKEIQGGEKVFLKYGLMEHGTLLGHGAYLGPDYSAEYLHGEALTVQNELASEKFRLPYDSLSEGRKESIIADVQTTLHTNRYDPSSGILEFTKAEAAGFNEQVVHWRNYFTKADRAPGLPQNFISKPAELRQFTSFFAWAAWASVANRPGNEDFRSKEEDVVCSPG